MIGIDEQKFDFLNENLGQPINKEEFLSGKTCIIYRNGLDLSNSDLIGSKVTCALHSDKQVTQTFTIGGVTDESYYEYEREGKTVITTAYFREQRELLSAEQFESEFQKQPFEAKGLLFNKDELNYFFELPKDRDPDTIIAVGDTAESGSDSTSMPVAMIYGNAVYIVDVVFDDSPAEVTKPECAKCLIENKVASAVFESNNAGQYYARDVDQIIRERGYSVGIRTKRTISNKQTRIEFASDNIKKNFYFKHPSTYKRGSQYWNFMKEVTTYTRSGKVPHDDAPDSLSLLENEIRMLSGGKVEVFKRPY